MGNLLKDVIQIIDGKIHFIPSGSATTGVSQSFNSTAQEYAVTMSGASLSQSILAPVDNTGSYFYIRQPDDYTFKVWFSAVSSSHATSSTQTVEPTGSDIPFGAGSTTPSSSVITVPLTLNSTGSTILGATAKAIRRHRSTNNRLFISTSNDTHLHLVNTITGAPPADDFSVSGISGSSFTYSVITSGSGLPNQRATQGSPQSASANVIWALDDVDKASAQLTVPNSSSFMRVRDGFFAVNVTNSTTGSGVSLHGGPGYDFGQNLPNNPYIKTNAGFDIYMDNANAHSDSEFRVFKNTALAGFPPGEQLLSLKDNGDFSVSGSIQGGTF